MPFQSRVHDNRFAKGTRSWYVDRLGRPSISVLDGIRLVSSLFAPRRATLSGEIGYLLGRID